MELEDRTGDVDAGRAHPGSPRLRWNGHAREGASGHQRCRTRDSIVDALFGAGTCRVRSPQGSADSGQGEETIRRFQGYSADPEREVQPVSWRYYASPQPQRPYSKP